MSYALALIPNGMGRPQWKVPGRDYHLPRSEGPLTLLGCFEDYIREWCVPEGGDADRAWIAFRAWIGALGHDRDVATLIRADGRKVADYELARGVSSATARKHLTMGVAALHHAKREERLAKVPMFQMPARSQPRVRWLTREERTRLLDLPKPAPRQLFWLLAFNTGARTEAMLEADWSRTDLQRRTIDFRVPGVVYKNKRRTCVPINDALLAALEAAERDPVCQRLVTRKGKPYSQGSLYHECKADLAKIGIVERGVARHVARHTVATWMLRGDRERGIPPATIHQVALFLGDTVAMMEKNLRARFAERLAGRVAVAALTVRHEDT